MDFYASAQHRDSPRLIHPALTITLTSRKHAPQRLRIGLDGLATLATQIPSPNQDDRPEGAAPSLIVVHGISLPPGRFGGDGIERLFTNRLDASADPYFATIAALRVSAHFLVRRDGMLLQFVSCERRAWHAGPSSWRGRARCNDFSVGVELEGADDVAYETPQYRMLARLIHALQRRYPIEHIAGHSDIAPGRKTDPGMAFDWTRLARLLARRNLATLAAQVASLHVGASSA